MRWHVLVFALAFSVCCSAPVVAPRTSPTGSAARRATADVTLPPAFRAGVGWAKLPASIGARSASGPCGQPAAKLVSAIDPPSEIATGRWLFRGCLYSGGNSFTQVFLELAFPDGTILRSQVADRIPPDREYTYEVSADRNSITGVVASLYAVTP